jgi:hypothetical protein
MRARLAFALLAVAPAALAQGVSVSGTNTVRIERYDTSGPGSPFPIETSTGYDELVMNATWQPSSFDRWRALFAGVANDSPYRSPDRGVVPERMLISRENGEGAIPYRAEVGDFFAFTSVRTQQRPLKGAAVELQPILGDSNLRTSVLLFGGAFQPTWRHFQWGDDNSLGLSWLTEFRSVRVTVNAVRNERDIATATATTAPRDRTQNVVSVAADAPFALGASQWRAEAEVAKLRGDTDGFGDPTGGLDRSDTGVFAQLSGTLTTTPFSWRLRGERYGRDYRPFGAAVPADRRSAEAHVSWQSPGALLWRARVQEFRDQYETANRLDTRVVGAAVSGPITAWNTSLNVDVFRQDLERADRTLDQRNLTANAFVSQPMGPVVGQLGLLYQRVEDHVFADASPRTKQVTASVIAPLRLGAVSGTIAPGVVWREVSGSLLETRDFQATLQLALFGGPHRLSLNAGHLSQDPARAALPEVATVNFGLDYRFRWGRHELGADVVVFDRKPKPGEKTEAWRAGLSWVYAFDATPAAVAVTPVAAPALASTGPVPSDAGLLAAVAPGDSLDTTLTRLAASGFAAGTRLPDAVLFESRLLREVDERQRMALVHSAGTIDRVVLLVSLSSTGGADDAGRTYERVRRALIDRFGRPATTFEEGTFGPNFAQDLAGGRLIRVSEWRTERGMLRLGIPRRLDGTARIEVHHARSFASARDTGWGLESVR